MTPRIRAFVAWVVLAIASGCRSGPEPPHRLVLVTVDTLRPDHLGLYGYGRPTSPTIDALARESAVFTTAVPTCPATAPSVASILTGMHRASHRVFGNNWRLPSDVETLAKILRARGFRTIGRVANPVVDAHAGFGEGFDDFGLPPDLVQSGPGMFEGEPLVADAVRIIDGLDGGPVFLWLHFMDPHGPYFPPAELRERFPVPEYRWPDENDLPLSPTNYGLGVLPAYQLVSGQTAPSAYRARYDAEIAYVDAHVGRIVQALRDRGLWDGTVFVLTADHGESLGEHGYYFQHGWFVYDDSLHVPLLVHGPGVPAGRRVAGSVSLVDLAPTVLDLLGLPPGAAMEGRSLRPFLDGDDSDREAFAQTYYGEGMAALRRGRWKYVFKPPREPGPRRASMPPLDDAKEEWLFDLDTDPGERTNLVETRTDVAASMRKRLLAWLREQGSRASGRTAEQPQEGNAPTTPVRGDPQLERQLRALGYVE